MLLTSNLFSQVTLPYSATLGTDFSNTSNWENYIIKDWLGNPTQFSGSPFVTYNTSQVIFSSNGNPTTFQGIGILQINPSATNIDYLVAYSWISGGNRNLKLLGSTDGINFNIINNIVPNNVTQSFDNTLTNYTYIMVKFNSTNTSSVEMVTFSMTPIITGIEDVNLKDNFNIYSYNKKLVVKSNDFKDYNLTVYNLNGQIILTETTNGNNEFTLNVANGMYIVTINDGNNSFNQKIVIQ